ncbi:hypothetical protein F0L68_17560 [Solihabitans fulvus]|uniref:Uncharacterized protein n=1 Tax=Solihabitans fulvus TaxID=1892852 RepID=A0A5B2XDT6_9PSEU|nr:hypothetical protein [Solihabitans fulvus]KAA2261265.1 hypothetical protein F0L68_17560 [Solihabitans fulvus]
MTSTYPATAMLQVLPAPGPRPVPAGNRELVEALRRGPFHTALHAAIRASGLSLEAIQRRLRNDGHQISLASLSYWQRGRSRPERPSSLAAVGSLERILRLPAGTLITLLGPVRPRGRWANHVPGSVSLEALGHSDRSLRVVSTKIDPDANQRLESLSHHQDLRLDATGTGYRLTTRRVVRARADGADRMTVMMVADCADAPPFTITAGLNCRLGRVVHDEEEDVTAAELIFHRPLRAGESFLAEYEVEVSDLPEQVTRFDVGFRQPTKDCVLQTVFHASAIPIRCYPLWQPQNSQPNPLDHELRIETSGSAHVAFVDLPAGRYGLCWEWN